MSALFERLKRQIKSDGPITVAEYMAQCLLDPQYGFYPTRDPLGSAGDFITAPEISQIFGEVIGLWCLQSWRDMGAPDHVHVIELGPGRGIMMADILRSAALDQAFIKAASIHLIEASSALEAVQAQTLAHAPCPIFWNSDMSQVKAGPSIILGNEFLDCMPIRQLIQKDRFAGRAGWHERKVMLDGDERLCFGIDPAPISPSLQAQLPSGQKHAKDTELLEICPSLLLILDQIKVRFETHQGRALFIDYGPQSTEFGDTLQALKRHKKTGVFSDPGNTDLTARVDFAAMIEMAQSLDLAITQPVSQREFLSKLGAEMRAVALSRAQSDNKADNKAKIARQLHRLTAEEEMGSLFKAICLQSHAPPQSSAPLQSRGPIGDMDIPLGFREFA